MKQSRPIPRKWLPPVEEHIKLNYNGVIFDETGEAGLGVVAWNSLGEVMASLAKKILKPSSMAIIETLAARRAILFAQEFGFKKVIF